MNLKFLFWIKNKSNSSLTELNAEKKLEQFRKKSTNYLYPSFNTISGSGPNGAIIHYRASKKTNRKINKKDIYLCDSGGQYKYGTSDVTRTICFSKPSKKIQRFFTLVLKAEKIQLFCICKFSYIKSAENFEFAKIPPALAAHI